MVGLLGRAIAAGVGGAAEASQGIVRGYIDDERKIEVSKALADIDEEKQLRIEEVRRNAKYDDDVRRSNPTGELATAERENKRLDKTQELELDRNETITRGNDKGYLGAKRNMAQATHIESADSVASAAIKREELQLKRKRGQLFDNVVNAGTPEERAAAERDLQMFDAKYGNASGGDQDVVKVTEEKFNDDGSTTKTESTQKRRATPVGTAAPTQPSGARYADGTRLQGKDGKRYVVKGGVPVLE